MKTICVVGMGDRSPVAQEIIKRFQESHGQSVVIVFHPTPAARVPEGVSLQPSELRQSFEQALKRITKRHMKTPVERGPKPFPLHEVRRLTKYKL